MAAQGISASVWMQNVAALLVGGLGALWALSMPWRLGNRGVCIAEILCVAALCGTFAGPGVQGVHRWMALGPVSLNAAFLCVPVLLWAVERDVREGRSVRACALCAAVGALLCLQPDASMASAFALGVIPALGRGGAGRALRVGACAALLLFAAAAWIRPDGLEPVAHVEGILALSRDSGPVLWALSLLSLLWLFWPFALGAQRPKARALCAGFALAYAGLLLSSAVGVFPVPVIGYGVSPVIGYLICAACAVARWRESGCDAEGGIA